MKNYDFKKIKQNKKIVVITGASKGIGKALVAVLISKNYFVIGTSRDGEIKNFKSDNFYSLALDLSSIESIKKAHTEIFNTFKSIDVLINNAGVGPDLGMLIPDKESFDVTFGVNVTGTVFFTEPLIKMIRKKGVILNMSSKLGSLTACDSEDSVAYRMSKSALNMYTTILKNRLHNKIKVASIHPGWVKTSIRESNLINARLTPEEAAENIYNFLIKDIDSGIFWDSETEEELLW